MVTTVTMNKIIVLVVMATFALFTNVPSVDAIHCYSCNSADYLQGADCRDSPVSPNLRVDCDKEYPARNYTVCRILVQDVEGDSRIVRTCGTNPHNKAARGCIDRTGTNKIKLRYCDCQEDECNGVDSLTSRGIMTSLICLLVIALRLHWARVFEAQHRMVCVLLIIAPGITLSFHCEKYLFCICEVLLDCFIIIIYSRYYYSLFMVNYWVIFLFLLNTFPFFMSVPVYCFYIGECSKHI